MASADRNAALRALLVDQVDATRVTERHPAAPASRRQPGRFQFAIVTAAVAAVVVTASVAAIGLGRPPGVSPAGHSQAMDTATPTTAAAATEATPTEAPSAPPSEVPSEAPSATLPPASALITPDGWHLKTRSELHDWVVSLSWASNDPANTAIWEQEQWTDIQCMAQHGFVYDPEGEQTSGAYPPGLTTEQRTAFSDALDGPQTNAPYDWRTAGCHGRSVHLAGQDNAH